MPDSPPTTPLPIVDDPAARRAFTLHARTWQNNRYVYPVVSRRSKGISIGINLNPDKICNFDCIYCSVNRTIPLPSDASRNIDLTLLHQELAGMLDLASAGGLYLYDPFDKIPKPLRRINDIAFSGDGEPTTCPQFHDAVRTAADLKTAASLHDVKLVLITNATMFHKPLVRDTLALFDQHNGEIWAKLDAGTDAYYQQVDRTAISLERILQNILWCAQTRPTVIQSLFMQVHGNGPSPAEIDAYAARLATLLDAGGRIKLVQLYTVARRTTESFATPLSLAQLQSIADLIHRLLPTLPLEIYP